MFPNSTEGDISKESYAFLQAHIYQSTGIVLDGSKKYLMEARLVPIVRQEKLKTIDDLCVCLRANAGGRVAQQVLEAMTTNETLFFRDGGPFLAMRRTLLPAMVIERAASRRLSFWSAAASSGQEAYTLAIMLLEMGLRGWTLDILATDISERILERARTGRYMDIEVTRGLPPDLLAKYFTRDGTEWRINDEVRRMVRFEQFDLRKSMRAYGPFDFVLCRNVLIYFDIPTKRQIFEQLEGTLNKGGYLLLGAAETTLNLSDCFDKKLVDGALFYQYRRPAV